MNIKRIYIDGGILMHKGFFAHPQCAVPGADLESFLQWVVEKVEKLKSFGFEPVVVFDGCSSEGTRKGTAANREKKRTENYEKYVALLNDGKVDYCVRYFS